jgi:hypothetical protein
VQIWTSLVRYLDPAASNLSINGSKLQPYISKVKRFLVKLERPSGTPMLPRVIHPSKEHTHFWNVMYSINF